MESPICDCGHEYESHTRRGCLIINCGCEGPHPPGTKIIERPQREPYVTPEWVKRAINSDVCIGVQRDPPAHKPATPEPPEWKGEPTLTVAAGTLGPNDVLHIVGTATWPNGHVGPVDVQVLSVEKIDCALEDFTARRKAKREVNPAPTVTEILHEALKMRDADKIARAMSTPLPHDPPMSVRLMPWRGK